MQLAPAITKIWNRYEIPTWLVVCGVYTSWLALTAGYGHLPWWALGVLGGLSVAWHGSLQHEAIHGHPTRSRRLNDALVWAPLSLWIPYDRYRTSHLAHHRSDWLTHPQRDPESFYFSSDCWREMNPVMRGLCRFNNTLLGRLTLGPVLVIGRFWIDEARRIAGGDRAVARIWAGHLAGVLLVLAWVIWVCGMPVTEYVLFFAYPGLSLTLLRSFTEHIAHPDPARRTAVVHAGPLMSLLFLNNNLHMTHHARPTLSWHRLPAYARQHQRHNANAGAVFEGGYLEIARRHAFRPVASPIHPYYS